MKYFVAFLKQLAVACLENANVMWAISMAT